MLDGQAAVNFHVTEPGLFFKATDGDLFKVGPVAVNVSGNAPNAAPSGTAGNTIGETWLDGRAAYANPVMKVFNGTVWAPSSGFAVDDTTGNFTLTKLLTIRTLEVNGTGANSYARMPQGPTTDQSLISGAAGMFRFDTTTEWFKGHDGTAWYGFAKEGDSATFVNLTVEGNSELGTNCATDTVDIRGVMTLHCDGTLGASSANSLAIVSEAERRGSNMTFTNQGELRFSPGVMGSTYVGFEAPNSVPSSVTWKLPAADGTSEQALVTDGAGNLTWESIQGGAYVSENPPTGAEQGDLWYDCNQGRMFVYYDDGNTVQWVDTNPAGSGAGLWQADGGSGIQPTSAANVVPNSNGGQSLGESGNNWSDVYALAADFNSKVVIASTGQVTGIQNVITALQWNLEEGNNWAVGSVAIPQPTNGVEGQSGTITLIAAPTSWPAGGALKFAEGVAPSPATFPAVLPFYVKSSSEVLLGVATEGIV